MAAAPASRAAKPAAARGGGSEVDDLLGSLDGRAAAPARAEAFDPTPTALLPEKLSRQQILMVVKQNAGKIRACKAQDPSATGTVMVSMVIGSSGPVTEAKASGPFQGTPVGDCVEKQVQSFRFPAFRGEPMRINMPFGL
ncbi:MAG: AgmX/PglI C-terminal domain-containing protein [bacterium]